MPRGVRDGARESPRWLRSAVLPQVAKRCKRGQKEAGKAPRDIVRCHCERGPAIWSVFKTGREGQLWYFSEVTKALRRNTDPDGVKRILSELERQPVELSSLD